MVGHGYSASYQKKLLTKARAESFRTSVKGVVEEEDIVNREDDSFREDEVEDGIEVEYRIDQ